MQGSGTKFIAVVHGRVRKEEQAWWWGQPLGRKVLERRKMHKVTATDNKEKKKPGSKESAEDRYATAAETLVEYDSWNLLLCALLGNASPRRMYMQSISGAW